jgi:hypothetical protein
MDDYLPETTEFRTIRIPVPVVSQIPEEMTGYWLARTYQSAAKTYQGLRRKIKNVKDFQDKIAKPAFKNYVPFFPKDVIFRGKFTGKKILELLREKLMKAKTGRKYLANVKKTFQTVDGIPAKRFLDKLEGQGVLYGESLARHLIPFTGLKGVLKGLAPLAVLWVTGNQIFWKHWQHKPMIIPELKAQPIMVCAPERKADFSRALHNRLIQAGSRLTSTNWDQNLIRSENNLTNQLVNKYLDDELIPFSSGAESHIDFIIAGYKAGKPEPCLDIRVTLKHS